MVSCLGNWWSCEKVSLMLFPTCLTFTMELWWAPVEKYSKKKAQQGQMSLWAIVHQEQTAAPGAGTPRELGVLPWERQDTKAGVAQRYCGHALFNTMGTKPKEESSWCLKPELCFINLKIHIAFPTRWYLLLCNTIMKANLCMLHSCDQSHSNSTWSWTSTSWNFILYDSFLWFVPLTASEHTQVNLSLMKGEVKLREQSLVSHWPQYV